ncbi:hypothetical protein [Leptospira mayottensis]
MSRETFYQLKKAFEKYREEGLLLGRIKRIL